MEGTGFLKTVNFGGFDKKDVLAYVDELNTKIYTLEGELDKKTAQLESMDGNGGINNEEYEKRIDESNSKIAELQTSNDSLKNQMKSLEDELSDKNKETDELKAQITELENQLQEAKNKAVTGTADTSAIDLGNVFIEAQKTANIIVTQAKENARKMDEDAKKLANQVVDDANGKASTIVKSADERAARILSEAEDKSHEMRTTAQNIKNAVQNEINDIDSNVSKLKEVLEMFSSDSLEKLASTKTIIDKAQDALHKGIAIDLGSSAPMSQQSAPAPVMNNSKPTPKPAPAPAPINNKPKASPKFGGFDTSELERLTKAAEAQASHNN